MRWTVSMLPLPASPNVSADTGMLDAVGDVLDGFAAELSGAVAVARNEVADASLPTSWLTSESTPVTVESAYAQITQVIDALQRIRNALYQTSDGYRSSDRRSADRHEAIAW
jgi:uncharacterized protein YukE